MNSRIKKITLIIISIIMVYSSYITIEVIRFNKNLGMKPLITITTSTKEKEYIEYTGITYKVKYTYYKIQDESSDHIEFVHSSGTFKLFGKFPISMWIT